MKGPGNRGPKRIETSQGRLREMEKREMFGFIDAQGEAFSSLSDKIWGFAETAFVERASAEALCGALEAAGFSVERGICGIETAFCGTSAVRGAGGRALTIGFLGEYDALFNMSQKAGVAVREELQPGGTGHGCGHNMLGTASLAAAIATAKYAQANDIPCTVQYFGCPGEEGGSGKAFMAKEGAFDGLDLAFCWHPAPINAIMHLTSLANYQVLYKFKGLSSHAAAAPELGRSALDALELMNVGANFLREHVTSDVRFHYAITNAGGLSPNVVQPEADVLYLIRAPKLGQVDELYQRINKIARGAAMMTETEVEIRFIKACANLVPNEVLSACLYENFKEVGAPTYTEEEKKFAEKIRASLEHPASSFSSFSNLSGRALEQAEAKWKDKILCDEVVPFDPSLPESLLPGSSDVGDVSWNVPTGQIAAACFALGTPMHSWQAVSQGATSIAHKGLLTAAKVMAGAAVDAINDPTLADRAKEEFDERMIGGKYVSPIPDGVRPTGIASL